MVDSAKPLRNISPTVFTMAKECGLKAVWAANRKPRLLPASPTARAGIVAHQLLAEAGQGRLHPDKQAIVTRWNELTQQIHSRIKASPIERHLVPLSRSVPDLAVRRIRAVQRAHDIARSRNLSRAGNRGVEEKSGYGYEIPVRSSDGLVRGRIDSVIPSAQGPVIQDYKSGSVLESSGENEGQLREEYLVQLKIYAALYAGTYGGWPSSLRIVPLSGTAQEIPFSKPECSELLSEAGTTFKKLNDCIRTQPEASLLVRLAKPGPTTCRFCEFRPACPPYLAARVEGNADGWPTDIVGSLAGISQLGNGKLMLRILTTGGLVNVPGISSSKRHPQLSELSTGDPIGVFALWRARPTAPYSESFLTTICRLPVY